MESLRIGRPRQQRRYAINYHDSRQQNLKKRFLHCEIASQRWEDVLGMKGFPKR